MRRNNIILLLFFVCLNMFPQGIKVKEVKETVSGSDAFNAPLDENGHPCGLVKVLTTIDDLVFEGNVRKNVENKTNEYHVFLSKGSDMLIIKRPHILPLTIKFKDYGIDNIASKATYIIILKEDKMNASKNGVVVNVRPAQARVRVDDILIENDSGNGLYRLILPKGDHVFQFEEKGFRPSVQIIKAGKGFQTLNIELESLLADLEISCKTGTAEIWIGDEMKGKGAWQGKLPAGSYVVTAKQKGYSPQTKRVTLEEKSYRSFVLPMLERAMGKLLVKTDLTGVTITIDGQSGYKSDTPIDIKAGQHTIIATLPFGYKEEKIEVEVGDEKVDSFFIKMKPKDNLYAAAFNGDINMQIQIRDNKSYEDSIEVAYWNKKINEKILKMDDSSFLLYCDKVWPSSYRHLDILLRQAELDKRLSDDDRGMIYSEIANYYKSEGNFKKAIDWRKRICEITTARHLAFRELAQLYELAGEKRNAVDCYKKSLGELGEQVWELWNWYDIIVDYADACLRLGGNKDAATILNKLISKNPNNKKVGEWRLKLKQTGY